MVRALSGRLREPLEGGERGFLLETWVLHELRAAMAFHNTGGQLHYWRTPHGSEVDFIWTRARRAMGIEVKASERWCSEFGGPLIGLLEQGIVQTGFGVYTGAVELKDGLLRVLPLRQFLKLLAKGDLFP